MFGISQVILYNGVTVYKRSFSFTIMSNLYSLSSKVFSNFIFPPSKEYGKMRDNQKRERKVKYTKLLGNIMRCKKTPIKKQKSPLFFSCTVLRVSLGNANLLFTRAERKISTCDADVDTVLRAALFLLDVVHLPLV